MSSHERALVGGPQDGGQVCRSGYPLPATVYVGRKPLGDGHAAWSSEPCERFPAKYAAAGDVFRFSGYTSVVGEHRS